MISVPPAALDATRALVKRGGFEALRTGLGPVVGRAGATLQDAVFRWSEAPAELPDAGIWLPWDDPRIPVWLHPFGGQALVTLVDGRYVAGVGLKRHDRWGHELAVVTDEDYRGGGLARRLVAQAAVKVIADGAVPTYLHDHRNIASAHVADAAGFPDRSWRVLALWDT
jgi:GNAT superfamily N-acetyltransferase